ncbi:MAG: methyltransferase domain-containing protein [Chitinophagaceae bacterium]|nr:methyltransferase domain-containing protein [Chitinophagaceae bacterium]MCW5925333.1 methyltransferase domain-containing protein [Chitinophagaceae bacterium]
MVSIYHSWLNTSVEIIKNYRGDQPLAIWLKSFFSQHRKYGSRDRRQISHLCYSYYRLGKWGDSLPPADRILTGLLLCSQPPQPVLEALKPEWQAAFPVSLPGKIYFLQEQGIRFDPEAVFPWQDRLSNGIDGHRFSLSFLQQPDLFIRIRPGYEEKIRNRLRQASVSFNELSANCLELPNATDLKDIIMLNREAVIQDYNSQNIEVFLRELPVEPSLNVWDCCAASGGKSILAKDVLGNIQLTVSDIRPAILANLKIRFAEAGIKEYQALQLDLENKITTPGSAPFDLIICDVPCTGSGTWSRTPEQLYFFEENAIAGFSRLQRKIAGNAASFLKKGGYFLYITCSVFKEENEVVVRHLEQKHGLTLVKMDCLKGYDRGADTMFGALFVKQ